MTSNSPCTVVLLRPGWIGRHPLTLLRKDLLSLTWSLIYSTVMVTGIAEPSQDDVHKLAARGSRNTLDGVPGPQGSSDCY